MKENSIFKVIFWVLAFVVLGLMSGVVALVSFAPNKHGGSDMIPILFIGLAMLFAIGVMTLIGVLVFKDAKKKGLDPWMWATITVFAPNLIGVIIYLVVRSNYKKTCVSCGKGFQGDYKMCPYCGTNQELLCEGCNNSVNAGWKHCPSCGKSLT